MTGRLHVTFVCTGNICRSPMAALVFARCVDDAGLTDLVRVTSAGIDGWHAGEGADPRTVAELEAHEYDTEHTAAQVDDDHLAADLIVALDSGHVRGLLRLGASAERVALLRSFDPDADSESVADPYYSSDAAFTEVREQIEAAIPGLLEWVRSRVGR